MEFYYLVMCFLFAISYYAFLKSWHDKGWVGYKTFGLFSNLCFWTVSPFLVTL